VAEILAQVTELQVAYRDDDLPSVRASLMRIVVSADHAIGCAETILALPDEASWAAAVDRAIRAQLN
jgi:hypothetical protein